MRKKFAHSIALEIEKCLTGLLPLEKKLGDNDIETVDREVKKKSQLL